MTNHKKSFSLAKNIKIVGKNNPAPTNLSYLDLPKRNAFQTIRIKVLKQEEKKTLAKLCYRTILVVYQ